mgnify:CR=1 FL=1
MGGTRDDAVRRDVHARVECTWVRWVCSPKPELINAVDLWRARARMGAQARLVEVTSHDPIVFGLCSTYSQVARRCVCACRAVCEAGV